MYKTESFLKQNHVIQIMYKEHQKILFFLDELEKLGNLILAAEKLNNVFSEINQFKNYIENVIDAETHHQREELVIFPELEKRGISGPPKVMRWEHDELRSYKKLIHNLILDISE